MLASLNTVTTADPASTKRSFFANEGLPIPDDQEDTTCNTNTIEEAMRYMDKKHSTAFHAWVRSESNLRRTCAYMQPIIAEFELGPPHVIHRAVKWLTAGWSVLGTAELIVKLFFHWGIGYPRFANLVAEVTRNWALEPYTVELVSALVVGEEPGQAARFIKYFTEGWDVQSVVDLVSEVAKPLKWEPNYYKYLILNYVSLDPGHRRMTVNGIRQRFELRDKRLANFKPTSCGATSGIDFCTKIFEMCVLEVHELGFLRKLESTREAFENTGIPSQEDAVIQCGGYDEIDGRTSPAPSTSSIFLDFDNAEPVHDEYPQRVQGPTLRASSSSFTLVADSAPSLLSTSTSRASLGSLSDLEAIFAHSRYLLEEHRNEMIRQSSLLNFLELCALASAIDDVSPYLCGAGEGGNSILSPDSYTDSQLLGRREE